jgi:hypothetical protein
LKDNKSATSSMMTRRIVLTGGMGCALALLIPKHALAVSQSPRLPSELGSESESRSDLFAFRGSETDSTVIAVTWVGASFAESNLRIHAGERMWDVVVSEANSRPNRWNTNDSKIFAGNIGGEAGETRRAVVIETPTQLISHGEALDIWAERFDDDGSRFRTGSPFLADIVACDREVARLYHASSPAQDSDELAHLVARSVAAKARANGYAANADQYGRRVASIVTPDVLRYSPKHPVGFTFAAQNGRHPDDASQVVVDTVLNGALGRASSKPASLLQNRFPYFS